LRVDDVAQEGNAKLLQCVQRVFVTNNWKENGGLNQSIFQRVNVLRRFSRGTGHHILNLDLRT
jgi:hypothetical protein